MKNTQDGLITPRKPMSVLKFCIFSLLLIVGMCFIAIWFFNTATGKKPYSIEWNSAKSRIEIEKTCLLRLNESEKKALAAIDYRAFEFSDFIRLRKSGIKSFSNDITSYYGKWRAIKPYIPFTNSEGHKEYIIEKFNQYIFKTQDFSDTLRLSIEGCIKDLESIENDLAVALRQEILGRSLTPNEIPIAKEEFKKAIEQLIKASQWDATKTAGNLVVSEVTSIVLTQVLINMGISAGILGAGATNSWWSFGISIVIGIIVDLVWEWYDDPAGDIAYAMANALDDLAIKGSSAIQDEMRKILEERNNLWSKTVEVLIP